MIYKHKRYKTRVIPDPELPVIMLSGVGQTSTVVKSMKAGAYDYIDKSFEVDELQLAVEKAVERRALVEEIRNLKTRLREQEEVDPIVGVSAAVQSMKDLIDNIADTCSGQGLRACIGHRYLCQARYP